MQAAFQGSTLQVALDGKLQTFDSALDGGSTTSVSIPATSGSNQGTAGIGFQAGANRGKAGGQRADDLVVSAFSSLSLPVENNFTSALDYGDAPNPGGVPASGNYNAVTTFNGPSHIIVSGLHIGATVDGENNAFPNSTATGDDANNTDDEDGIAGAITAFRGTTPTVSVAVTNTTGAAATLYGWIDYNSNGLFDNAKERASVAVPNGTNGSVAFSFPTVPAGAASSTFARFRLSSDSRAQNPVGAASNGEVEDYQVSITAPPTVTYDFTGTTFSEVEGNATNSTNVVMLTRSDTSLSETVDVVLSGATAVAGSDFTAGPVQVSYGVGEATKPVPIEILGDRTVEPAETLNLSLTNFSGVGQVGTTIPMATYTINNDDILLVAFNQATGSDAEASGGNLPQLLVSGEVQASHIVSISTAVTGGTATGTDFGSPSTLNVGAGTYASTPFAIPSLSISNEAIVEPDETIILASITGNDITVGVQSSTTCTINNDDTLLVAFNQPTGSDAEASGGNLPQLLVSGEVQAGHVVSISTAVTGGTAPGTDFGSPSTLNVGAGTYASTPFAIPSLSISDDSFAEPNETIDLANITGNTVTVGAQSSTTYTILDDDSQGKRST